MGNCKQIDAEIANCDEKIKQLQDQRALLQKTRDELAEAELAEAVAIVIALGGTASIAKPQQIKPSAKARLGPKKYRNPATGAEWSGQGIAPSWIKDQSKQDFINPAWKIAQSSKKDKQAVGLQVHSVVSQGTTSDQVTQSVVDDASTDAENVSQLRQASYTSNGVVICDSSGPRSSVPGMPHAEHQPSGLPYTVVAGRSGDSLIPRQIAREA